MGRISFRVTRGKRTPEHAADVAALEQGEVEREAGDASRETDHQETPFPGDAPQRRLGIDTADGIEDDVRAAWADGLLE